MAIAERPTARERHFREMAVWHEWPVPDGQQGVQPARRVNVGPVERMLTLVGGAALAAFGLSRRTKTGAVMGFAGAAMMYRGASGHCPAYSRLGINNTRRGAAEPIDFYENGIQVTRAVTINASAQSLFRFWRDFTNLPRVMSHLQSVEMIDDVVSHWVAKGPMNSRVEWNAEIINEEPYELIAWRSLPGAEVDNAGSVRFVHAPGGRGTQLRVNIEYIPAAGKLGAGIARIFGEEPGQQVREDLRRFKQLMEAGEVASTCGQPVGHCAGAGRRHSTHEHALRAMTPRRGYAGVPRPAHGDEHEESSEFTHGAARIPFANEEPE